MLVSTSGGQGKHCIGAGEAHLRVEESHPEFLKFLEVVGLSSMSFLWITLVRVASKIH